MRVRLSWLLPIAAVAAVATVDAATPLVKFFLDDTPPSSAVAVKARARYEAALSDETARHQSEVARLRSEYIAGLAHARKHALERSDVDEAQRIVAVENSMKAAQADAFALESSFAVIAARWGAGSQWADVTAETQALVKDGTLKVVPQYAKFRDPKYGTNKTFLVVYAVHGDVSVAIVGHDEMMTLPPSR